MDSSTNQVAEQVTTKTCTKCGKELPVDRFSRKSSAPDGLQNWCKDCQRVANKASYGKRQLPPPVKGDPSSPLAEFTPRQLIDELHNRGYRGELHYIYTIKV